MVTEQMKTDAQRFGNGKKGYNIKQVAEMLENAGGGYTAGDGITISDDKVIAIKGLEQLSFDNITEFENYINANNYSELYIYYKNALFEYKKPTIPDRHNPSFIEVCSNSTTSPTSYGMGQIIIHNSALRINIISDQKIWSDPSYSDLVYKDYNGTVIDATNVENYIDSNNNLVKPIIAEHTYQGTYRGAFTIINNHATMVDCLSDEVRIITGIVNLETLKQNIISGNTRFPITIYSFLKSYNARLTLSDVTIYKR